MAKHLVRLELSNEFSVERKVGSAVVSTERVSERGLRAHVILADSKNVETEGFGFVHLRIEAEPRDVPPMTPNETLEWLCAAIKKML